MSPFAAKSLQNHKKIRGAFKMGPQASKMSPRASKIMTQNQENPRKKTARNGTVAGNARSALDIHIGGWGVSPTGKSVWLLCA